jgi:hypothetical protein
MSSFGVYLASVSVPIAQRVLTGIGIGVVTYVGLDAVMVQIQDGIIGNWAAIPLAASQLLGLAGVPQAIGIVLGSFAARFSMMQLKALSQIA